MWLTFAFLSALLLGFYDVFKKKSLFENAVIPVLFINTLICGLLFTPSIIGSRLGLISDQSSLYIPTYGFSVHGLFILKAAIVLSSWILGYFGLKHLPLTIVGPINATRPIMTLVGALLIFGERLNLWQWAGVILAILSFFLLSKSGKKEGIRFGHNAWVFCIILAAVLGACSGLYDKYLMAPIAEGGCGLNKMAVQGWYNIYQCLMMLFVLLLLWMPLRKKTTPFTWKWSILFISLFLTAADLCYFYALSLPSALVAVVSMVRRSSVIVSFMFGALVFREKHLKSKAIDLLFVLLGMICIWIGTH